MSGKTRNGHAVWVYRERSGDLADAALCGKAGELDLEHG